MKRTITFILIIALLLSFVTVCYAAEYNTVSITSKTDTVLSYSGVTLSQISGRYVKGKYTYGEKVYALSFNPKSGDTFDIAFGNGAYGRKTMTSMLASYKTDGKVLGAINGDFFSYRTGLPLGIQIQNGVIITSNSHDYDTSTGRYAVAVKNDGTAFTGIPDISVSLDFSGSKMNADRINAYPQTNISLITSDYGDRIYWDSTYLHDVVKIKTDGKLKIGGAVSGTFEGFLTNVSAEPVIEKGYMYLVSTPGRLNSVKDKAIGSQVSVSVTEKSGGWQDVKTAVGGGNLLINAGVLRYTSTYDKSISDLMCARSAVGIKADGSMVLYAVERDAAASYSGGVTLDAVAQALYDMGCVYAVNFDGEGSTTFAAAGTDTECKVINRCEDGSERKISNCIVISAKNGAPEIIGDFEKDTAVSEQFTGLDMIDVSYCAPYTGVNSLKADYKLAGNGHIVSFKFNKPYSVSAYSSATVTVKADGSGAELEAILTKGGLSYSVPVCILTEGGYTHECFDVSGADYISGFSIRYNPGASNSGSVVLDRLVGSVSSGVAEYYPPDVSASLSNKKITVTADDGKLGTGIDSDAYLIKLNGTAVKHTVTKSGAYADSVSVSNKKINKIEAYAGDKLGNLTKEVSLYKSPAYTGKFPYTDTKLESWAGLYIQYCTENSIIDGMTVNGKRVFKGSSNITRAQFCTMLMRGLKVDVTKYSGVRLPYEDAANIPKWAILYVKAAYATGVMVGSATKTGVAFEPSKNITRAEAATAVDRTVTRDFRLCTPMDYYDSASIPSWAVSAVKSVTAQGIFQGNDKNLFNPKNNLTRSETAVIMSRIF